MAKRIAPQQRGHVMPFRFNQLLDEAGVSPGDVRLLRHQPVVGGKRLIDVWRADPAQFEAYQSYQAAGQRSSFARPYWAAFIGTWDGRTMFAGLYAVGQPTTADGFTSPICQLDHASGTFDRYPLELADALADSCGRLYIDWGGGASGKRAWTQKAEAQDKLVTELHLDMVEQPFPGLMELALSLSSIADAPPSWAQPLTMSKGIYLLTCPRDGSLYVGSAVGNDGFWGRWAEYRANGHGGNIALVGREPSDFIVSVLEVAGSASTNDDILAAEAIWKRKLQSRELGLNRN